MRLERFINSQKELKEKYYFILDNGPGNYDTTLNAIWVEKAEEEIKDKEALKYLKENFNLVHLEDYLK